MKIYKAKIQNGNATTTLSFNNSSIFNKFKEAVQNCIDKEDEFPSLNYHDNLDEIVFSATYLKNSLIIYPKNNEDS